MPTQANGAHSVKAGSARHRNGGASQEVHSIRYRDFLLLSIPYLTIGVGLHVFRSAWIAILSYHAAMAAALLLAGRGPWSLLRGWSARSGVGALLVAAANGPAFIVLWRYVARADVGFGQRLISLGLGDAELPLFALWYAVVHPILEEAFWRGTLFTSRRGPTLGDIAFAGYHLLVLPLFIRTGWAIAAFVILAATAFGFRLLAERHCGLAVPVAAHAAAGASTMIAALLLRAAGGR